MSKAIDIIVRAKDATASAWKSASRKAESFRKKVGRSFKKIGAAAKAAKMQIAIIGAAFVAAGRTLGNFASQIRHTSDNLEIHAETLQAINAEALKYGMSLSDLDKGLARLRQSQGKVIDGDKMYIDAVKSLNINLEEFKNANTDKALELLAKGYASTKDRAAAFSAVSDLMGRSAKKATKFLKAMAEEGLAGIEQAARDTGHVLDDELITKLELFGTRMERLGLRMKVFGANLGNDVYTGLDVLSDYLGGIWAKGGGMADIFEKIDSKLNPPTPAPENDGAGNVTPPPDSSDNQKDGQEDLEREIDENERLRREQLEGLANLEAEYVAKEQDLISRIASTPIENQGMRKALFDRATILKEAYEKEVDEYKAAMAEKADIARKERLALEQQAADLRKSIANDAIKSRHEKNLQGAEGEIESLEKQLAKRAEMNAMSIGERRSARIEAKRDEKDKEIAAAKRKRIEDKERRGARLGKSEREFLAEARMQDRLAEAQRNADVAKQNLEQMAITNAEDQRKQQLAKLTSIEKTLADNLRAA